MEIHIAIENLKDMLADRKEDISTFKSIHKDAFYNDDQFIRFHTSHTVVIFALTKKLRQDILGELQNDKMNIILVVGNDINMTPVVKQLNNYDKLLRTQGYMLQWFRIKNLLFNPTKHYLVPKHIKLSQEEASEVISKYLVQKTKMPCILSTDAIGIWLGLKRGDVVKIERLNENSGISYYYRICT